MHVLYTVSSRSIMVRYEICSEIVLLRHGDVRNCTLLSRFSHYLFCPAYLVFWTPDGEGLLIKCAAWNDKEEKCNVRKCVEM